MSFAAGPVAGRARAVVRRLPLRVRLVAGFVVAVAVVLAAAGAFVYWRVEYALDLRLDGDLRSEASTIAPLVGRDGVLRQDTERPLFPRAGRYQVLGSGGAVLSAGADVGTAPLLTARQFADAAQGELITDVGSLLPASPRPLRLIAVPLPAAGSGEVLVVADRRDARDEALRELLGQLVIAGAGALLVTAVVGERLARAALAPVERYRSRAADIAAGASGLRLDVPPDRDDEVTRLGHTLNSVLDALEHAVAHERQFTQDASHELRTPLTLLSTRVQLALARPRSPTDYEATLRELARDVAALEALARQLLDLGTVDRAAPTVGGGCDLADVAREVACRYADATAPEGVVTQHPERGTTVAMSRARAGQVVGNLLANATVHGGPPVHLLVDVRVCEDEAWIALEVADRGAGMSPEFLPMAADRFARADTARSGTGTGLGLSLVRALVERDGGELRLCSGGAHHRYGQRFSCPCTHPTAGTTATVLLPLMGSIAGLPPRASS